MSRFVSEGTKEDYTAQSNDAWAKAKQEVEALRKPKQNALGSGIQEGGLSLYETLQANKDKKQAEFEEAQKLKNQFETLNEDDVRFLDSVRDKSRAKENAEKKETADQLKAFRQQREAVEKEASAQIREGQNDTTVPEETWSRKRRRKNDDEIASKVRKTSTADSSPTKKGVGITKVHVVPENKHQADKSTVQQQNNAKSTIPSRPSEAPSKLGLGGYDSDED